jgi:outer membrane protein
VTGFSKGLPKINRGLEQARSITNCVTGPIDKPRAPFQKAKALGTPVVIALFLCRITTAVFSSEVSLEDARRAALLASTSMKKLEKSKQTQALTKMASYFKYLPSLSAGASASYPLADQSQADALDRLEAAAQFSLSESITLFDGGRSRIERSNLALEDSSLDAETQARFFAVIEEADNRYFTYLEAEAAVKTAELQMEMSSLALETAEIRHSGGILSPSDYFLALANTSAAEGALAAARTGLSLAKSRLEQFTGIDILPGLMPINFEDYEELCTGIARWTMEDSADRYQAIKAGLSSRSPSLKSAYLAMKRAENDYALYQRAFSPTLDLSLSFNMDYRFTAKPPADPFSYGASVTLGGRIPLDYWVLANNERRQKYSLESSRIDYADTLAAFDIDLQSMLFTLAGSARTLIASRQQADYSELLLEQQRELFRLSSASMTSFLDASSRFLSSEIQKTKAEYTFLRGLSALKTLGAFEETELFTLLKG